MEYFSAIELIRLLFVHRKAAALLCTDLETGLTQLWQNDHLCLVFKQECFNDGEERVVFSNLQYLKWGFHPNHSFI